MSPIRARATSAGLLRVRKQRPVDLDAIAISEWLIESDTTSANTDRAVDEIELGMASRNV
jgi:hypothetical protein